MALIQTAWLMGSEPNVPETQIDVTANAVTETLTLPASDYYPWDPTAANSCINQLHDALESHSEIGIGGCTAFIGRDRLPRFTCGNAFSIDSWTDLTFRTILGFTGTEAFAATTQIPSGLSNYLWSPGRCEIPDAPLGSQGLPYHDTAVGMSGDAVVVATTNNSGRKNSFRFNLVQNTRAMLGNEIPGQYSLFWGAVVRRFYRWKLYRDITEEDELVDATQATLTGEVLGPYKLLRQSGVLELDYQRELTRLELYNTVELPALLVDEY